MLFRGTRDPRRRYRRVPGRARHQGGGTVGGAWSFCTHLSHYGLNVDRGLLDSLSQLLAWADKRGAGGGLSSLEVWDSNHNASNRSPSPHRPRPLDPGPRPQPLAFAHPQVHELSELATIR